MSAKVFIQNKILHYKRTPHPDFYLFLEVLKKIQFDTKNKIQTATNIAKQIRSVIE